MGFIGMLMAGSALLLSGIEAARACGGFFCATVPMDQAGERILFAARDGMVTTHVQIQYSGEAPDFAWILPVPSLPEIQISHNEVFRQLSSATRPAFFLEFEDGFFGGKKKTAGTE